MASIHVSPILPSEDRREEMHALNLKLDDLFIQYLNTLDEYQKARLQLSTEFSSGFFSLAQANFTSNSRMRYGKDYYDERMQATRRIIIGTDQDGLDSFALNTPETSDSPKVEPLKPSDDDDDDSDGKETPSHGRTDPLRWFGILVPPALRSAQSHFVSAVEGPILLAASLRRKLGHLEIEIGRTRKTIRKLSKA